MRRKEKGKIQKNLVMKIVSITDKFGSGYFDVKLCHRSRFQPNRCRMATRPHGGKAKRKTL